LTITEVALTFVAERPGQFAKRLARGEDDTTPRAVATAAARIRLPLARVTTERSSRIGAAEAAVLVMDG
jgi:hypothetical protein